MLVSLGITCFNAHDTIERAVQSALAQTWPEKEIIIVDDGSTDGSRAVLSRLAEQNPEVRIVLHPENRGYACAVNTIVSEARGAFVAILDDDDVSEPERIALQIDRILAYEAEHGCNLVLCYTNRAVVKVGSNTPDHVAKAIGRFGPEPSGDAVADFLFGISKDNTHTYGVFGSCTLTARRGVFQAVGQFDETFRRSAEWDFAVRAAFLGTHFIAVDQPLVIQWKTESADKAGAIPLKYALRLREKHKDYLIGKRAYLASRALARSRFFGNINSAIRCRMYLAVACALHPALLVHKLRLKSVAHP